MAKLDPVQIQYIIDQKDKGKSTKEISLKMKVCGRWVQKLYARYLQTGEVPVLGKPGRPQAVITDEMRTQVSKCFKKYRIGAVGIEKVLDAQGIHIPHNTIHQIMRDGGMSARQEKKSRRRKWVRYERTYSNSMCGTPTISFWMTAGGSSHTRTIVLSELCYKAMTNTDCSM